MAVVDTANEDGAGTSGRDVPTPDSDDGVAVSNRARDKVAAVVRHKTVGAAVRAVLVAIGGVSAPFGTEKNGGLYQSTTRPRNAGSGCQV